MERAREDADFRKLDQELLAQLRQRDVEVTEEAMRLSRAFTPILVQVGLIVLGTHGRTGLSHVVMGSVAERVVRLAPCPVLTVKAPTPEEASWLQGLYETFLPPTPV